MADGQRPLSVGLLLLARPLDDRLRARVRCSRVGIRGAERRGRRRRLDAAPGHRADRPGGLGLVPARHRDPQPASSWSASCGSSGACATASYDEAAARGAAQHARLHEPLLRPRHARGHEALADVPARAAVRPRLRHRHRGRAARHSPARAAAGGLPFYAILCLPILFAAGMSLLDTIDGAFMNFAYGWAFAKPVRKVFYNITITGALGRRRADHRHDRADRGPRRQAQPHRRRLGLRRRTSTSTSSATRSSALFVAHLGVALAVWRFGRIEERWTARLEQAP